MAERRGGNPSLIRRYPRTSGALLATALALGGCGLIGYGKLLNVGIDPLAVDPRTPTQAPMFPGAALPDQNPTNFESTCAVKPKAGCLIVREGDTAAGILERGGEQLYDGKQIQVIFSAPGHGGGIRIFPASTFDDLAAISDAIWPCDMACFPNPIGLGFAQQNTGVRTSETCVTVGPGDTAGSIFARTDQVPDGKKDALRINGDLYPVKTDADFDNLPDLIALGSVICPE